MAAEKREDETQTAFAVRIVKEEGAAEFAAGLRERLVKADATVKQVAATANSAGEETRLNGKAEGVRLALSYLDEMARGMA